MTLHSPSMIMLSIILATGWGLCTSWINDSFGVKNSLLVGFSVSFVAIVALATANSINMIYFVLFGLLPLGNSMGLPMLTIGIKRFTTTSNRAFAFGVFYSVMNIAAFVSGLLVDMLSIVLGDMPSVHLFGISIPLTAYRMIILSSALCSLISFVVTWTFMREIKVSDVQDVPISNEKVRPRRNKYRVPVNALPLGKSHSRSCSSSSSSSASDDEIEMSNVAHKQYANDWDNHDVSDVRVVNSSDMSLNSRSCVGLDGAMSRVDSNEEMVEDTSSHSLLPIANHSTRKQRLQHILMAHHASSDCNIGQDARTDTTLACHPFDSHTRNRPNLFINTKLSGSTPLVASDSPSQSDTSPYSSVMSPMATVTPSAANNESNLFGNRKLNFHPKFSSFAAVPLNSPVNVSGSTSVAVTSIDKAEDDVQRRLPDESTARVESAGRRDDVVEAFVPVKQNPFTLTAELLSSRTFWRFTALTLFLVNLKSLFRHLDATLPTYLVRTFGSHVPKGTIYAINPFIIMLLTPVIASATAAYPHYDMIKFGGYISGNLSLNQPCYE